MNTTDLLALADECARLTEPDAVVNGRIEALLHIALPMPPQLLSMASKADGVAIEYDVDEENGSITVWIGSRKFKRYRAPDFTGSVGDALLLATPALEQFGGALAFMREALDHPDCRAAGLEAYPRFLTAALLRGHAATLDCAK